VLLAISGDAAAEGREGSERGFGVLLRALGDGWEEVARTPRLAPGQGGVDFEGALPLPDGRSRPVVQVSDCRDGCCPGVVQVLGFEPRGEGIEITADELFPVGASRGGSSASQALVSGARPIAEAGGPQGLLLRFETREGRANPAVSYLRIGLDGARPRVSGVVPTGAVPRCE